MARGYLRVMLSAYFKTLLLQQCKSVLASKMAHLHTELSEISESMSNETKSSVGDKHETARARMQAEQEKLGRQLSGLELQLKELERISTTEAHVTIGPGSLVETNKGFFFISAALGKVICDGKEVYAISPQSPLAQKMKGLKAGSEFEFNTIQYKIKGVF